MHFAFSFNYIISTEIDKSESVGKLNRINHI